MSLTLAMGDPLSICSDPHAAVCEMSRITKPGGIVIATADNKFAALDHYLEQGISTRWKNSSSPAARNGLPPMNANGLI